MACTSIDTGIAARYFEPAAENADGTHIPALAHELSDTALALLLCYAAEGHCRFTYEPSDRGSGSEGKETPEDVVTAGLLAAEVAKVRRNGHSAWGFS